MGAITVEGYIPEPHQAKIHQKIDQNKYIWVMGGFRSGKSRACFEEDIDCCMRYPNNVVLITRRFHEDLEKTSKREFYEYCNPALIAQTKDSGDLCVFRNGSQILFRGLHTKDSKQRSKLGSLNIGRVHVEEGSEIELNDFLDLQGRLSLTTIPESERKIYITANPPTKDHWAFNTFEINPRPGYATIRVGTRENAKYLPSSYVKDLEESYSTQPGWLSRFFDGNWGFTPQGDPVYPGFSEKFINEDISFNVGQPVYRCWDFGWHHPAVVCWQSGPDAEMNILWETMGNKVYLKDFAPIILKDTNLEFPNANFVDICDDAGKQRKDDGRPSIEILENDFHLKMRYRHSFVQEGIEIIQSKMRLLIGNRPGLSIKASKCPILVEGFRGGYCREGDDIVKDGYYEHLHDALREGVVNMFAGASVDRNSSLANVKIPTPKYGFNRVQHSPVPVGAM